MRRVTGLSIRYDDGTALELEGADAREVMAQIDLHIARSLRARRSSMDSVWIVYEAPCRRGTYVVRPFNDGYYAGPPALLVRAPTRRDAVLVYKSLK